MKKRTWIMWATWASTIEGEPYQVTKEEPTWGNKRKVKVTEI